MNRVPADMVRGRLSDAEEEQLQALHAKGHSTGRIAQHLRRHPSTIHFAKTRLGLVAPVARQFSYLRKGRPVVSFDADEDAFLSATRTAGHDMPTIQRAIAVRFGRHRSVHTLRVRLVMLANREEAA